MFLKKDKIFDKIFYLFSFIDLKYREVRYMNYEEGVVTSKDFENARF